MSNIDKKLKLLKYRNGEVCANCMHFDKATSECRGGTPHGRSEQGSNVLYAAWPRVHFNDWCYSFSVIEGDIGVKIVNKLEAVIKACLLPENQMNWLMTLNKDFNNRSPMELIINMNAGLVIGYLEKALSQAEEKAKEKTNEKAKEESTAVPDFDDDMWDELDVE